MREIMVVCPQCKGLIHLTDTVCLWLPKGLYPFKQARCCSLKCLRNFVQKENSHARIQFRRRQTDNPS